MTAELTESATGQRGGSWQLTQLLDQAPGFHALSDTLAELTDRGHPIVVGTADLKYSNGLVRYAERYPDRFIQFGISEQNMLSAAAGLASTGLQPYVATFASFLALLCAEQIRTDTAYTNLPVRMVGHHSGVTLGFYGTSHHATEDLAITRSIANLTVLAPADATQLSAMIRAGVDVAGPVYLRIGRGRDPRVYAASDLAGFAIGKAITHSTGRDLTIVATGSMVHPSLEAAKTLCGERLSVGVIDMHTIKPFDAAAIAALSGNTGAVLTVEEHNIIGGLGAAVAEVLAQTANGPTLFRHGIPDEYAPVGPPTHLYAHYRLDARGIAAVAREVLR
ncbi:transketolase family protein [Mycolicibacterium stellerae]|uniref:transketolase family protein n=1 Tax=Mycolicibacterium stellerae TaxID=2358193 RepID=UPI001F28E3A6|nr:transketolase C-terminal domain-containing protein [Mycolicibacterium stellerae]